MGIGGVMTRKVPVIMGFRPESGPELASSA